MSRGLALLALAAVLLSSCSPASHSHHAPVIRVGRSPAGRYIAAADAAGRVWIIDESTTLQVREAQIEAPVNDLRFSPDERTLAIASRDLLIWDHQSPSPPRNLTKSGLNFGTALFLASGGALLTVTGGGTIQRLEISSGRTGWSRCCTSIYGEAAVTPLGDRIVTAGHLPRSWDSATGRLLGTFIAQRSEPAFGPVALQPDSKSVWIGCQDGILRQWDMETRAPLKALPAQPGWIESIAISPDGAYVAFTVRDRGIRVWDAATGVIAATAELTPSSNILFTSDGSRIIAGTRQGSVVRISAKPVHPVGK